MRFVVATYLWVSMFILGAGMWMFHKVTKMMFFGSSKRFKDIMRNPVMVAWYLLLPPNMVMTLVYFIEHAKQLILNIESQPGPLCNFVAFWAISAIVSLNGASITIAYVTFRLVRDGKKPRLQVILIGNAIAWICGLVLATIFLTGDSVGPYQGLYCCVKQEEYYGFRVALIFTTFVVSILSQSFLYFRSYKIIKGSEGGALQSSGGGSKKASKVIMQRGMEMVAIFYLCWFLIAVNSLIAYSGGYPNIWLSSIGAWFAKLNPMLHCMMMYRNLKRINKINVAGPANATQISSVMAQENAYKRIEDVHLLVRDVQTEVKKVFTSQMQLHNTVEKLSGSVAKQFEALDDKLQKMEEHEDEKQKAPMSTMILPRSTSSDKKLREQLILLQQQNKDLEKRLVEAYKKIELQPPSQVDEV